MPPTPIADTRTVFDATEPWMLHPRVAVRPEPFGALLYHFGTRRLSFLKDRRLLQIVQTLDEHPNARVACAAQDVSEIEMPQFVAALDRLAASDMLVPRRTKETSS